MVSEVIFPRFWGVVCIEKCFRNFEIVIGSAVLEISRFARFYVNVSICPSQLNYDLNHEIATIDAWNFLDVSEETKDQDKRMTWPVNLCEIVVISDS